MAFKIFVSWKIIGYFKFYGGQQVNLVKGDVRLKIMYNHVSGSLNSEQLAFAPERKSKIVIYSLVTKQKSLGAFKIFVQWKKLGTSHFMVANT